MLSLPPVLLVDDDPDCIAVAKHLIRSTGIPNPLIARDGGEAAIEYLRSCSPASERDVPRRPAVLLLDLKMPVVDGLDVLRWLRQRPAFDRTRVIMWSNSPDPRGLDAAIRCGADAMFRKFPSATVLGAAIRAALELHRMDCSRPERIAIVPIER